MRKSVLVTNYWLPVIAWCALIFAASGDTQSFNHSSRLLGPFVKWLLPRLSEAQIADVVFYIRKCAHATEYAVLAWLLWRALRQHFAIVRGKWSWGVAQLAWFAATIYAATDELHQGLVPNRQGSVWDVLLDSLGALLGLAVVWFVGRRRRSW